MMPHGRKDAKFDSKSKLYQLNELAELYNCNNVLFFEARKGQDLYMWASKVPNGPTVKMHVQNCKLYPTPKAHVEETSYGAHKLMETANSTHDGGTPLHRQLSQGLAPRPVL